MTAHAICWVQGKSVKSDPTIEGFGFSMCRLHMLKIKWETRTQPAPMPRHVVVPGIFG
jgi:hypothetical protein